MADLRLELAAGCPRIAFGKVMDLWEISPIGELRCWSDMVRMSATIPEEYKRLYLEFEAALANAAKVLRAKGWNSEEFRQADSAAGA
jgi:hypothetical protein